MKKTITYLNIPFKLEVNRFIMSLLFLCMLQQSFAQVIGPGDWSSLRLYGHAFNVSGFTTNQYDFIANHNYLFTIEKRHDRNTYGDPSSEIGSSVAAQQIKNNNPVTKPLFYWNSNVVYESIYQTITDALAENPTFVASNGKFNYENSDFPDWWVSVAQDQVNNTVHDGVFIDACQNVQAVWGTDAMAILFDMLDQIPGLVIANGFWPSGNNLLAGPEMLDHVDGIYVESFFQHVLNTTAKGKVMLDALLEVPANKYIITSSRPDGEWANDHTFAMASFLIIANDYSFFHHFNGSYNVANTQLWHEDFGKYIGAPEGVASVNGYVYTRSFENAEVTVDLLNKTSSIVWGNKELSIESNDAHLSSITTVFPNPFSDNVLIKNDLYSISKAEVFNQLGQMVQIKNGTTKEINLNLNHLSNGLYFVKVTTSKGIITKKIIKQ